MLKTPKTLGLAAALTMLASSAFAATFTADYDITSHNSGSGLIVATDPTAGSFSVDLEVGQSATVDLFLIYTNEDQVNPDDAVAKPISVAFDFADLGTSGVITGATDAVNILSLVQFGFVTFGSPIVLNFGSGGTGAFSIALSTETFNGGRLGLDEGIDNGSIVTATISYLNAAVPLPAAGLLLVTALGAAAALRRRKDKAA